MAATGSMAATTQMDPVYSPLVAICIPSNTWFFKPTQVYPFQMTSCIGSSVFAGLTNVPKTHTKTDHTTLTAATGDIYAMYVT